MQDLIVMKKGQSQCNVVADVDLYVVGQALLRLPQKVSEGVVHQLHQKNGHASYRIVCHPQILHDVGVAHLAEEAALLLEHSAVPGVHQDGVEDFGCT